MQVITYGTRGSAGFTLPDSVNAKYGGNTTCLRILSDCLPDGMCLVIDAGTGLLGLDYALNKQEAQPAQFVFLFTHYHLDHVLGLTMLGSLWNPQAQHSFYGPKLAGKHARWVFNTLMQDPLFPVDCGQTPSTKHWKGIDQPTSMCFAIHPKGGLSLQALDALRSAERSDGQLRFGGPSYDVNECLIVTMAMTVHPRNNAVSYRFEERPTGRVFVLATDHEKPATLGKPLAAHMKGAHLLLMDSQYTEAQYAATTSGFGHGTPEACVEAAKEVGAHVLGLTHHAHDAADDEVDFILECARRKQREITFDGEVVACSDYLTLDV